MKDKEIPRIRARADEVESIFSLFAIQQELKDAEKRLSKRIDLIPNAKRDIRMLRAVSDKLTVSLLRTIPEEKLVNLQMNLPYMTYAVYFNRFQGSAGSSKDGWVCVQVKDFDLLSRKVHEYYCWGCDKKCDSCDIGKLFDRVFIQSRRKGESWGDIKLDEDHAAGEVEDK